MKFYGTDKSIREFRQIIIDELNVPCEEVSRISDVSESFTVDLTREQKLWLQENVWHRKEDDAPLDANDRPMPWNWRISPKDSSSQS